MMRLKMTWKNEAGLTVSVSPAPGTSGCEVVQTDANGPCVWNGQKAWIFPVDGQSNVCATIEMGGKKEKQLMSVTAFRAFIESNRLVLVEEEIEETLGSGKTRNVKHDLEPTFQSMRQWAPAPQMSPAKPAAKKKGKGK